MNTDTKKEIIHEIVELTDRVKKLRKLVKLTTYQLRKENQKIRESFQKEDEYEED